MSSQPSLAAATGGALVQAASAYAAAVRAAGGQVVQHRTQHADELPQGVGLYTMPSGTIDIPALPLSRVSIALTPTRLSGGLGDRRPMACDVARYALFLVPAGATARWSKATPSRHLTLLFSADPSADAGAAPVGCTVPGLDEEPLLNVNLPGLRALADELVAELEAGPPWSAEAVQSLGRLLLIRLARNRARQRSTSQPLTPALLARMAAHVQAHLSGRIGVGDLAAVVGLPTNRFAQAYTASTGQSPYQFVLAQRLQRAEAMLRLDDSPLAQVAAECGFASQQHLTQVMRQRRGTTPARYRRQHAEAADTGAARLGDPHAFKPDPGARHRAASGCP